MDEFGHKLFQNQKNSYKQKDLYLLAINQIIKLQLAAKNEDIGEFNEISAKEQMELFEEWFLSSFLKLEINELETELIKDAYVLISRRFLGQKRTLCHFDFELRNLMLKEDGTIGVLDFQDLIYGPLTLDLVSLIKDLDNPISYKETEFYLKAYLSMAQEAGTVSYTHLRAHETPEHRVCRRLR